MCRRATQQLSPLLSAPLPSLRLLWRQRLPESHWPAYGSKSTYNPSIIVAATIPPSQSHTWNNQLPNCLSPFFKTFDYGEFQIYIKIKSSTIINLHIPITSFNDQLTADLLSFTPLTSLTPHYLEANFLVTFHPLEFHHIAQSDKELIITNNTSVTSKK